MGSLKRVQNDGEKGEGKHIPYRSVCAGSLRHLRLGDGNKK